MRQPRPITVSTHGDRQLASSGSPWEPAVGYSRAVRVGPLIAVTGTLGLEPDGSLSPSLETQTRRALAIIVAAIEALGGKAADVIRTRLYVRDITQWEVVGSVHHEFFGSVRPATTMVEVSKLIDDKALIEIEADAFVSSGS